jgi:Spy/CpxP family protein refolding chaperone
MVVSGFLAAPVVHADEGWKGMHEKRGKNIQEIYTQLKLTDEQKKKLEDNKTKHHEQKEGTFKKMRSLREALKQELMKSALDMNKINEIQTQIKAFQAQTADDRLNHILEVRAILTAEQFAKFNALMEKRKHGSQEKEEKEEKE